MSSTDTPPPTEPTPRPWAVSDDEGRPVVVETSMGIAGHLLKPCGLFDDDQERANVALAVRAVNSHDALVEALEYALGELDAGQSGYDPGRWATSAANSERKPRAGRRTGVPGVCRHTRELD